MVDGLRSSGRCSLDTLVKVVYDDVDTSLHKMAKLSLSAHLIKLREEARVREYPEDGVWELL